MKSDLSKVKEGDTIWTVIKSRVIERGGIDVSYPIMDIYNSYTLQGNRHIWDEHASDFTFNPFEKIEELEAKVKELEQQPDQTQERVVLVRNFDDEEWQPRVLHMELKGFFYCWKTACLEHAKNCTKLIYWQQMKELPKLTAQEAADKLGITLDELKELQ